MPTDPRASDALNNQMLQRRSSPSSADPFGMGAPDANPITNSGHPVRPMSWNASAPVGYSADDGKTLAFQVGQSSGQYVAPPVSENAVEGKQSPAPDDTTTPLDLVSKVKAIWRILRG